MKDRGYAELHAHSAFTFLEGTDTPLALVQQAQQLGLTGISILDVDGMYSAVQTAQAGRQTGMPIVYGTELTLDSLLLSLEGRPLQPDGKRALQFTTPRVRLPVLATSQDGYRTLSSLLSSHFLQVEGRREASLSLEEIHRFSTDIFLLTGTSHGPLRQALTAGGMVGAERLLDQLIDTVGPDRVGVEASLQQHDPAALSDALFTLAQKRGLPLVATGAVRTARPEGQPLADVLSATRLNVPLAQAEPYLPAWRTFLRSHEEMLVLHHRHPEAVANAGYLAGQFNFDFRILEPGLPHYPVPEGESEETWLRHLTYRGALERYGTREHSPKAWKQIDYELDIIEQLGFPGYFLIVKDIVDFCSRSGILCQGRGSAANSAVCYALSITAVDAVQHRMLFERFLSPERSGAPDIDLDIEAKERERVIQYVYNRYGRHNAALVANTITYRPKSAVRDAARAFGFPEGQVKRWSKQSGRGGGEVGAPPAVLEMAHALQKLPRHMGIHPGGMVLTRTPVSEICPVRWGAMEKRSVLQWDKEDCAEAGLVKFDLLGLGMLTALRRSFNWLEEAGVKRNGRPLDLYNLPPEDPRVYDLLCAADTVGVFQVESRGQMNTLPRLKPRKFYDIVIEVALIRPGPIQGRAVNPYLNRRNGREEVTYLHPLMENALKKTLGVPLFQEQLMQIAVEVAGFTPAQADELRRAIGAKRSAERMQTLKPALFAGMAAKGVPETIREKVFEQLRGFAEFGFPESHAFSFAYLVYASAWLKVHHPEHFYASILASQPMGFYSPASLVEDARRHGVNVAPPSVLFSEVVSTPRAVPAGEQSPVSKPHHLVDARSDLEVRLGLETVRGLGVGAKQVVAARADGPFVDVADLAARARLSRLQVEKLAAAGALDDLGITRREGLWAAGVLGVGDWHQPFLPGTEVGAQAPHLPRMSVTEELEADYRGMGLSVGLHPVETVREQLNRRGVVPLNKLPDAPLDRRITIAGVVTHRQRPMTARGTTFLSLEDETGLGNVICSKGLWRRYRSVALEAQAMVISGRVEKGDGAVALVADRIEALRVPTRTTSRDFR
ncbi:error-prone DNA polymerase [Actinomyces minihominis]|uniref:error-prone DNA polymerase n=1 Tax=Actinomyces minihominis TaxID=2002838 RepID=UPI000C07A977|nr:error-prone DNA polymerase [Actinomyces minihominis]